MPQVFLSVNDMDNAMQVDDIIAREIGALKVDCQPGCSWCCNQLVVLTNTADGKAILDLARQRTTAEEFNQIATKVNNQAREINALPYDIAEQKQWPCPLLKNKRCLVYEVRPIACRSVVSPDNKCCKAMLNASDFSELPSHYQRIASEISERAMRIQLRINNQRPINGAIELRSLLASLLNPESQPERH